MMNISNTELAKMIYENSSLSFGMIDSPNIIITTGTIDYDNGSCDGFNKNARTIYAYDKENRFHFGMILKKSFTDIQTISLEYLEELLNSNCLKRDDCIYLLFENSSIVKTTEYFGLSKSELRDMRGDYGEIDNVKKLQELKNRWENELSAFYGGEMEIDCFDGKYYACAFHNEPKGEYDSWIEQIKEFDCLGEDNSIELECSKLGIPVCR